MELIPQTTTPTTTQSKNTNAVYYDPAAQDQFTLAAQARNPSYQPNTDSFDINKYMFDQGIEYGWQDPLAATIFDEYAGQTPYTNRSSDYWLERAAPFEGSGSEASYSSPLDPREWGNTFGGDVMEEMASEYEKRALAGTPAAALDVSTGTAEGDAAAQAAIDSGGSFHALTPEIINQMWQPQATTTTPITTPTPKPIV